MANETHVDASQRVFFQCCSYFFVLTATLQRCVGLKNAPKWIHEVDNNYFYIASILSSFSAYKGDGRGEERGQNIQLLYTYDVGTVLYLFCYCQEFCLATRIQPALKTYLLILALFLLLHDSVLSASFLVRDRTRSVTTIF